MQKLVYTLATGPKKYINMAVALGLSLRLRECNYDLGIITDAPDELPPGLFDHVVAPDPRFPHWFGKLSGPKLFPHQQALFVDSDCLALRSLDEVFKKLEGSNVAMLGVWRKSLEGWYGGGAEKARIQLGLDAAPEINGGILYWERGEAVDRFVERTMELRDQLADFEAIASRNVMSDEIVMSFALAELRCGVILPFRAGISSTPWLCSKRHKLDVFRGKCEMLTFVEGRHEIHNPAIYHSAMVRYDWEYWREMRKVLRLLKPRYKRNNMGPFPGRSILFKMRRIATFWHRFMCGDRRI